MDIWTYFSKVQKKRMFQQLFNNSSQLTRDINVLKTLITFLYFKIAQFEKKQRPHGGTKYHKRVMLLQIKDIQALRCSDVFRVHNKKSNFNSDHCLPPLIPSLISLVSYELEVACTNLTNFKTLHTCWLFMENKK